VSEFSVGTINWMLGTGQELRVSVRGSESIEVSIRDWERCEGATCRLTLDQLKEFHADLTAALAEMGSETVASDPGETGGSDDPEMSGLQSFGK
jgi:hypothetical protein